MQLPQAIYQMRESTSLILEPTNNSGALLLGNITSLTKYKQNQVKAAISICEYSKFEDIQLDNHLIINIDDSEDENIMQYFEQTNKFIEDNLKKGNVLVHCMAGISRSASIVIAYIMWSQKKSYKDSYKYVDEMREIIYPNEGFRNQLKAYELQLKKGQ
ncbi:unnamed protein product (macronuclear) [Paramecium tetraurelia]|uniref:protein-tyrosine-phosphatase n=1 Tax=Paramecium tetraurelia TaxID=5888 RepID=A0DBH9_PARTE|nr:uncharacterized protein GSPATT00015291001 [Paramecium tetraurelia]CAK80396.1 unnamed protein product [Paramecium tetraurelia]|eukprot:XP_001447793.1 hypothetical protein (macronuclear) [Paramecium tetraurelia strain d4-2]